MRIRLILLLLLAPLVFFAAPACNDEVEIEDDNGEVEIENGDEVKIDRDDHYHRHGDVKVEVDD